MVTLSQYLIISYNLITRQYLTTPREEECHPGTISHNILQLTNMKSSYNNILHHQAISYDSPRGGVSQITEKGETTASFLLIQVISKKEEEEGD